MPQNPFAGPSGYVQIGSTRIRFGKWKLTMEGTQPTVNNFESAFQAIVGGLVKATLTFEGAYDGGNMPFTVNTQYTFICGMSASISYPIPAMVKTIEPSQDIDDAGRVTITAQSNGSFTAAIT